MDNDEKIIGLLEQIYGPVRGREAFDRIRPLVRAFPVRPRQKSGFFSNGDAVLITYGDTLNQPGEAPLKTLGRFARANLKNAFSAIHILPFFPYSSDDGFSVIDFHTVNPDLGRWPDINDLSRDFELMFDLVLNHISSQSDWFQRYLNREPGFERLAIEVDPDLDLSLVTRPRTTPLLTPYTRTDGETVHVWTTFSADQIDLNYTSLSVLEKMIEVLLFYVRQGAALIRLDAIAYLWKETDTTCIHCVQTHEMVKLFRAILDEVAPEVMIITETNVPHQENISYFGNGVDEAQMVYNFTLPPLLVYTFVRQDATVFSRWARGLALSSPATTFFNFTASHDGIGVRPLEGILPAADIAFLADHVRKNGGAVSCKRNPDGSETPYELNITYVDALSGKDDGDDVRAARFLASQAVQLVLPGVPGIYIHSLLGSRNWNEGVAQTGRARTINRRPLQYAAVSQEIETPGSLRHTIFYAYLHLLAVRRRQPAFHPGAAFDVMDVSPHCVAVKRTTAEQTILAVTGVCGKALSLDLSGPGRSCTTDLLTGQSIDPGDIRLAPFQTLWLTNHAF